MDKLIEALNIFMKYGNPRFPTHCEHDVMYINVRYEDVSEEDIVILEKLGFSRDFHNDGFKSFYFGSC